MTPEAELLYHSCNGDLIPQLFAREVNRDAISIGGLPVPDQIWACLEAGPEAEGYLATWEYLLLNHELHPPGKGRAALIEEDGHLWLVPFEASEHKPLAEDRDETYD